MLKLENLYLNIYVSYVLLKLIVEPLNKIKWF